VNNLLFIALGANVDGAWGTPAQTIDECARRLAEIGLQNLRLSPAYRTRAQGLVRQPDYLNVVAQATCALSPLAVLTTCKRLERCAGRRLLGRNAPRPLDIDLLDWAGRIVNWPVRGRRPKLVLPHPHIAERAFVLAPLADLAPRWRHPVLGLTAAQLLERQGGKSQVLLRRDIFGVDRNGVPCKI
jgi:2-amino-4-hydroxy-6-hydroxymethyldihydropteridine diphosphokinase